MLENVHTDFKLNRKEVTVLALNRPPNLSKDRFLKELKLCLRKIDEKKKLILVGDVNINLKGNRAVTNTYIDLLVENGLIQLIQDYTGWLG